MSAVISVHQIPYESLVKILGKMDFKTACNMLRTCRMINEMVRNNSKKLYFPVELFNYSIWLDRTAFLLWCFSIEPPYPNVVPMFPVNDPCQIDSALFDCIEVKCETYLRGQLRPYRTDLIEYMKNVKIKAHKLIVQNGLQEEFDVMKLYQDCNASSFSMETIYHEDRAIGRQRPLPFDFIRELATRGCRQLFTAYCDFLPADYASVLAEFECAHIGTLVEEQTYSLDSIIKVWMTGNGRLKHFNLPIYPESSDFETSEELSELEKWPLETNHSIGLIFPSNDGYAFLVEHSLSKIFPMERYHTKFCSGYKASWNEIDQFVVHWVDYFIHKKIPFDASGLFQVFVNGKHEIRECMTEIVNHMSTYHFE